MKHRIMISPKGKVFYRKKNMFEKPWAPLTNIVISPANPKAFIHYIIKP